MHFRTRVNPVAHKIFPQIVSNVSSAGVSNMLVEHRGILQKFFISSFGSVWYSDIDTGSLWKNVMWIGSWFSDWPIWEWTIIFYRWNRIGWNDENSFKILHNLELRHPPPFTYRHPKCSDTDTFDFLYVKVSITELQKGLQVN
ncbi:Hypothetical_protein [Hexamita inflata]|uniref:Hypothetical_protein n=1 Tax=Hexamita inflata TaxID=28002 RepID=A0AA86TR55_9EUKA|nr:Hypothetical protein HINF_LOCUS13724 [Hexamita inflata]